MATALAVAFVVYSCKGKLGEAEVLDLKETPVQIVNDMFIVQSENSRMQMRAEAPLMEKYENDEAAYDLEVNGVKQGKISISKALEMEDWDVITFQQASYLSVDYESYQPYLNNLFNEVKKVCGSTKFYIHETWSYERDKKSAVLEKYNNSPNEMHRALKSAYKMAAEAINAPIIPVGDVIQHLRDTVLEFDYKNGGLSFNSDGMHLSQTYGRYVAALVWYGMLYQKDLREVSFIPPEADEKLINMLKNSVYEALKK